MIGAALAGAALNLRYIGIVASLSEVLSSLSFRMKLLVIHITGDENWALTMAERAKNPEIGAAFLIGSGLVMISVWTCSTALGALVGESLPNLEQFGLGFAFTAAFMLWREAFGAGRERSAMGCQFCNHDLRCHPRRSQSLRHHCRDRVRADCCVHDQNQKKGCPMSFSYWMLIIVLAVTAFSIRALGLFAGDTIRTSRFSWVLDELPGLIIVSLVASSLAGQPIGVWLAAAAALLTAYFANHVILTMCVGVTAYGGLVWIGL